MITSHDICHSSKRKKPQVWIVVAIHLFVATTVLTCCAAEDAEPPVAKALLIEPSSASISGAKANLFVTALKGGPEKYHGSYQIKVTPYFFKSASGNISIDISNESWSRLNQGDAVLLKGIAIADGEKNPRTIKIRANPSASRNGKLKISVPTPGGTVVFNTRYRLGGD